MRRKRQISVDDGFDLFLDTITNAFGGILLIAILIILMIRESSDSAPKSAEASSGEDRQVVRTEIEALQAEKDLLSASVKVHQDFEADFHSEELKSLAQIYSQKLSTKTQLELRANQVQSQSQQLDSKKRGIQNQRDVLKQQLVELENKLSELNEELTKEKNIRARSIPLPKEKISSKSEIPMIVKDNQLFVIESFSGGSPDRRINLSQFENATAGNADVNLDGKLWRTKKGAGFPFESSELATELGKYESSDYHFAFVVRSNSYEKFSELRAQAVSRGFEYRLILTDDVVSRGKVGAVKTQ